MQAIGTTRRIDRLGRVVLPAELRKRLRLREGDVLDIRVEQDRIVLGKLEPACVFCASTAELRQLYDKAVCGTCVTELTNGG